MKMTEEKPWKLMLQVESGHVSNVTYPGRDEATKAFEDIDKALKELHHERLLTNPYHRINTPHGVMFTIDLRKVVSVWCLLAEETPTP